MVPAVGANRIRPVLNCPETAFRATDATDLRLCPRLPSLRSVLPSRQGDVFGKIISKPESIQGTAFQAGWKVG